MVNDFTNYKWLEEKHVTILHLDPSESWRPFRPRASPVFALSIQIMAETTPNSFLPKSLPVSIKRIPLISAYDGSASLPH
jgi:hypothetical protein